MLEQSKSKSLRNLEWAKLQQALAQRSLNSTLIFSMNKQHSIHRSQPHIVIDAIKQMVKKLDENAVR